MKKQLKKSGQKIIKKLSRASREASAKSKSHIKEHVIARAANAKSVRLWILEWMMLVSVIILFGVVQTIWYHNSYQTKVFVEGGTYAEATVGQINSMNPLYATTSSEKTLTKLLFSSLLSADAYGNLGNDLAESVKVDDTGKIWTVTLRSNIKWSDGKPITSEDVKYSFNLINNPSSKTSVSTGFSNVKIEQVDELTIKFILPAVYVAFYDALDFPIVPAHILSDTDPALVYEHEFSTNPIGSGPFVFNALQSTASGNKIVHLNQNPNYHRGETMLASFAIRTYNSAADIADALNKSEVTASAELGVLSNPGITNASIYTKKTSINSGAFAFLNTMSSTLSNTKIRQAIRYGIDVDSIREGLVDQTELNYPILSSQIDIKFPEIPSHNSETANELLLGAGYKLDDNKKLVDSEGDHVVLNVATVSTGNLPDIAVRLETQLVELGFEVNLNIFETESATSQSFFTNVIRPRDYDILLYEIDMGNDPDLFPYYHSSQATAAGFNFSDYKNGIVDDLLLSARTSFDDQFRKAKYESFLQYWVNDVPAIGLYRVELTYYFNSSVRTFSENNTLSAPLDRFSDVLYWATEKDVRYRTP